MSKDGYTMICNMESGNLGFFSFFLVRIEKLETVNGTECSVQAAQARCKLWALNQCSE